MADAASGEQLVGTPADQLHVEPIVRPGPFGPFHENRVAVEVDAVARQSRVDPAVDFAPDGGGDALTFRWADPENDGDPLIDPIVLPEGAYSLAIELFNELEDPVEDVTPEVLEEGEEHQIFLTGSGVQSEATSDNPAALLDVTYADSDAGGLPLGLAHDVTTLRWSDRLMVMSADHEHHLEEVRSEMRGALRCRSLRATAPRLAVLVVLHEQGAPMTHEQIMEVLPSGQYDKASVWRLLSDLADAGVLRRMDLGDRVWRYELLDDCRPVDADHAHFLCETCGVVSCLPPLVLQTTDGPLPAVLQGADFRVRVTGTCAVCVAT